MARRLTPRLQYASHGLAAVCRASTRPVPPTNNAPVSKRRITHQQRRRIQERQAAKAARAREEGGTGDDATLPDESSLGPERPGQVVARYGHQADVLADDGVHRCHLRSNLGSVVTGDRVVFRAGEDTGVIVARQTRDTELQRPDKYGDLRSVAANIDQVVIVIAPRPEPHGNLVDRYLVATENLGAEAVILVNKVDLLDDAATAMMDALLAPYPSLGYPVIRTQAANGGIDELAPLLQNHTSILVGQSGVGKTTLVNALLPDADQRVGALSQERQKGRHTTTTSRLFPLPGGGTLVDSPGIREFGLWHMDRAEVEAGFREFREVIGQCRFRDCAHNGEPGCALEEAIDSGRVHPNRAASFRHIVASLDEPLQP